MDNAPDIVGMPLTNIRYIGILELQPLQDIGVYPHGHSRKKKEASELKIIKRSGAEVITGSTRMKSGTAQKLILNMISTGAMIKTGKVYENMMINLRPSNKKLRERMIRIVCEIKGCDHHIAESLLEEHDWKIRDAVG